MTFRAPLHEQYNDHPSPPESDKNRQVERRVIVGNEEKKRVMLPFITGKGTSHSATCCCPYHAPLAGTLGDDVALHFRRREQFRANQLGNREQVPREERSTLGFHQGRSCHGPAPLGSAAFFTPTIQPFLRDSGGGGRRGGGEALGQCSGRFPFLVVGVWAGGMRLLFVAWFLFTKQNWRPACLPPDTHGVSHTPLPSRSHQFSYSPLPAPPVAN